MIPNPVSRDGPLGLSEKYLHCHTPNQLAISLDADENVWKPSNSGLSRIIISKSMEQTQEVYQSYRREGKPGNGTSNGARNPLLDGKLNCTIPPSHHHISVLAVKPEWTTRSPKHTGWQKKLRGWSQIETAADAWLWTCPTNWFHHWSTSTVAIGNKLNGTL